MKTKEDLQLPAISREIGPESVIESTPLKLKKELTALNSYRKGVHMRSGFNSINASPRDLNPQNNFSTLEPTLYTRRKDLLKDEDDLGGITENNEWDEIWKYAKIKEQEEANIIKNKKIAQKVKFNNDLKQQIIENQKRRSREIEELKKKDKEMMEMMIKKTKLEENK